jgi:hypothetical protein
MAIRSSRFPFTDHEVPAIAGPRNAGSGWLLAHVTTGDVSGYFA